MISDFPDFWRRHAAPFTPDVIAAALEHANAEAPRESCGLVRAGTYVPCENTASEPENAFVVDQAAMAEALAARDLEGVIHSHPGGPGFPTAEDMRGQLACAVPYAIIVPGEPGELACHWGQDRPPLFDGDPLTGSHCPRSFCHGVSDCYSLIRDYFASCHDVSLPEFPREWLWWEDTDAHGDLYLDNLSGAGFRVVSTDPTAFAQLAEPGDVYLRRIASKAINHGGVYLGGGLALEHRPFRLSERLPVGTFLPVTTHWLRYEGH